MDYTISFFHGLGTFVMITTIVKIVNKWLFIVESASIEKLPEDTRQRLLRNVKLLQGLNYVQCLLTWIAPFMPDQAIKNSFGQALLGVAGACLAIFSFGLLKIVGEALAKTIAGSAAGGGNKASTANTLANIKKYNLGIALLGFGVVPMLLVASVWPWLAKFWVNIDMFNIQNISKYLLTRTQVYHLPLGMGIMMPSISLGTNHV